MKFILSASSILVVALLAGCGGTGPSGLPDRGEGSIPVGRAQSATLTLRVGDWEETLSPAPNGIVYAPSTLPMGMWQIRAERTGYYTENFALHPSSDRMDQFDVTLLPNQSRADLTSLALDHPQGIQLRVGETLKVKVNLTGSNVKSITPSYWVSGGVATINPGGVLKGKVPGTGTITADAFGLSSTATVTVVP